MFVHGDDREPQLPVGEAGEHAGAHAVAFHQLAQHLNQHDFEQAVEHGLAAAVLSEGFGEQQFEHRLAAFELRQWQTDERRQRGCDRVRAAAFEAEIRANEIRAALGVGEETSRHRPGIQQQAGLADARGDLRAMADIDITGAHEMQLPAFTAAVDRRHATQRAHLESACAQ